MCILPVGGGGMDTAFRGPLFPPRGLGIPEPTEIICTLPEKAVVASLFQKEQSELVAQVNNFLDSYFRESNIPNK